MIKNWTSTEASSLGRFKNISLIHYYDNYDAIFQISISLRLTFLGLTATTKTDRPYYNEPWQLHEYAPKHSNALNKLLTL